MMGVTQIKKGRTHRASGFQSPQGVNMKAKIFTSMILAGTLFAFGLGSAAKRTSADRAPQGQTTQGQTNSGMMGQGAAQNQGMMSGGMTGMMGQMTAHHQTMSALMNKMMESMAAIQSEKDPEALKAKLAEHQALLKQMQSQMMQQGNMMQMMSGQMKQTCPGAGENSAQPTK
jgi:cell fate (sporulation/competence/biofilm development) regulator YmcA (YheA/YmcA/DUF963 family)